MRIGIRLPEVFVAAHTVICIGIVPANAQTSRDRNEGPSTSSTYRYEERQSPSPSWDWSARSGQTYVLPDIWTGSYIGATMGPGAGLIVGSGWRTGNFLAGAELDGQFRTGSNALTMSAPSGFDSLNWSWAGRVRAGFLVHPRLYLYGMGGVALVNFDYRNVSGGLATGLRGGLQLGGGVEWKLFDQLSLRLDYASTRLDWGNSLSTAPHNRDLTAIQVGAVFRF